jgi:hypothetical protein
MMQMLSAGGMQALTDGQRTPDPNNPRGYYEFELVKSLARNPEVINEAEGKVVKVISSLLTALPKNYEYRVIFMRRPLEEIVASQDRMLGRLGKTVPTIKIDSVIGAFERHLQEIRYWLPRQRNISVLYVDYAAVLGNVAHEASRIATFLGRDLDIASMASQVERSLYREKVRA